jgi:hypothetical protein
MRFNLGALAVIKPRAGAPMQMCVAWALGIAPGGCLESICKNIQHVVSFRVFVFLLLKWPFHGYHATQEN